MNLKKTFKKIVTLGRHSRYEEGIDLYNQGLYLEALEKFKELTLSGEGKNSLHYNLASFYSGLIHRNLGLFYLHKGEYEDAIIHLRRALGFNPTHYEIYNYQGIAYNNWKKYDEAMASFSKVLEVVPELLSLRYKVAIVLYNLKKYDIARAELQKLVVSNPKFADFHYHLGVVFAHERHFEEAQKSFATALALNPKYFEAKVQYALTFAALGEFQPAVQKLEDLIREKPNYPDLYYYAGLIQGAAKDWPGALERIKKALELNPAYAKAMFILGMLYLKDGDLEAAALSIEKSLNLDLDEEQRVFAHTLLDSLDKRKKAKDGGGGGTSDFTVDPLQEEYLETIFHIFPKHLPIIPDYIEIMEKFGGKWDRPLLNTLAHLYEEEIAKTPDYADYHYQLGKVYERLDAWDKAILAYSMALEINPHFFKARIHLYKTYLRVEMTEKAKNELEILIKEDIRFPDICLDLASIYLQDQNWDGALNCLAYVREANPGLEKAILLSAEALRKKGKPDQALALLTEFREKNCACSGEVSSRILELEKSGSENRD
jgi:tetratricopeptide (TPR) repeat protein